MRFSLGSFLCGACLGGLDLIGEQLVRQRMAVTLVAGKTTNCRLAFEVMFVDGGHHVDHFARSAFLLLVVGVKLAVNVAE